MSAPAPLDPHRAEARWASLVADVAFEPETARGDTARRLLSRDGAVILTGLPPTADGLVLAAAEVFGSRLRRIYPVRNRACDRGERIDLHSDSHHLVVDVHGRATPLRDADEDTGYGFGTVRSSSSTTTAAGTGATPTTRRARADHDCAHDRGAVSA